MKDEQLTLQDALRFAIQMELDGKQFYAAAGKKSNNKLGKELFAWLATQEDRHRERFQVIFDSISAQQNWPSISVKPDKGIKPSTIFSKAAKASESPLGVNKDEFNAVEKAMDMEIKSRDFYRQQSAKAASDTQRKFFDSVAVEEQGHYLYLVDYKEYMADPTGWFTRSEHHLLDGA